MKLHPTLLAASSLLAILSPSAVRADDGILSFELSQPQWTKTVPAAQAVATVPAADPNNQPLPIPPQAANPPMRYHSPQQLPAGVYRRAVAVALNESTSATALLPPAPPTSANPVLVASTPPEPAPKPETAPKTAAHAESNPLGLDFGMEPSAAVVALAQAKMLAAQRPANPLLGLFEGNSDSLVAWAVGSAEGTRTPNGGINPAYSGHTDPGNRAWNMGTFSYQHGAKTPEEADRKQLARLKNQGDVLRQRALKQGLNLTLEETLNGLDLANQSPLAAIGRVGYIERLAEAKANGLEGSEAILVARTRSYINPNTGRWNAPGLGNTEASIRRDQQRRANAVANAIAAYESQNPQLQAQNWTLTPSPEPAPETLMAQADASPEPVDDFLTMWTSPSDPVAQVNPAASNDLATQPGSAQSPATESKEDGLAALWQITVDRLSQVSNVDNTADAPQTASLAGVMFNRDSDIVAPSAALEGTAAPSALDLANSGDAPVHLEPQAEAPELAPDAPELPDWEAVREGNQTAPAKQLERTAAVSPAPLPDAMVEPDSLLPNAAPSPMDAAASTVSAIVTDLGTADSAVTESGIEVSAEPADNPLTTEDGGSLVFESASLLDPVAEPPLATLPAEVSTPEPSELESTIPEPTASEAAASEAAAPEISAAELPELEAMSSETVVSEPAVQTEASALASEAIAPGPAQ